MAICCHAWLYWPKSAVRSKWSHRYQLCSTRRMNCTAKTATPTNQALRRAPRRTVGAGSGGAPTASGASSPTVGSSSEVATARMVTGDRAATGGTTRPRQIRSKFRASSQSVTWRLLASHSCSAVLSRWWCTSAPNASSGDGGVAQLGDRLHQGRGDARHVGRLVGVDRVGVAGLELVVDAVEARRDGTPPAPDRGSRRPRGSGTPPGGRRRARPGGSRRSGCPRPRRRPWGPSCRARSAGRS